MFPRRWNYVRITCRSVSDAPSDCQRDKNSDDDDYKFWTLNVREGHKKGKLEASNTDVNIDNDDGDVYDGCTE
jgi:hypothetical protein